MPHSPSDEQKAAMQAGRERAKVRNRILGFPLGATVKVHDHTRWNNEVGVVFEHNGPEVGVKIRSTQIWCLPKELEVIA
jgi:hypothetical protein